MAPPNFSGVGPLVGQGPWLVVGSYPSLRLSAATGAVAVTELNTTNNNMGAQRPLTGCTPHTRFEFDVNHNSTTDTGAFDLTLLTTGPFSYGFEVAVLDDDTCQVYLAGPGADGTFAVPNVGTVYQHYVLDLHPSFMQLRIDGVLIGTVFTPGLAGPADINVVSLEMVHATGPICWHLKNLKRFTSP